MPDYGGLPPSIPQGLGWSPAADPTQAPPVPQPPDGSSPWGGLPPSVPQGLGWAPPPDTAPPMAPVLPSTPTALPSQQAQPDQQPAGGPAGKDYTVPVSAFGAGIKPPSPNAPAKPAVSPPARPQSFAQGMADLRQRDAATEQAQQEAIGAGVDAQKQLHADQLAAYQKAQGTVEANAAARKTEDEQWQKSYATNQAKVEADRAQIDSWKFNRNAYMDSLGVGDKVRWGIGQILAGIGQGMMRQGGPNPVTEMLQQNIHDANEAQYKQRDALVQKLGFDRQTGMDAATYHATRQADLDKADGLAYTALGKQLEEAAVKSADPIARANGLKEAANVRAMGDERLKSYIQLQSQHDQEQQKIGIEGGQLALAGKKFDWEKQKDQQELDLKAAAIAAKGAGKLTEEESKRAVFIPGPDGKPIPATRQDGSVVLTADPGDAAKVRRQVASTTTFNALIGKMSRGIADHGGESDWWHSKDWQDMKTDYKAAVAELHEAYGVQSFREPTIEFFDGMTSAGLDPTAFNVVRSNATEALQNANRNVQLKMNGLLQAQGYDREPVAWQNTSNPAAPQPNEEQRTLNDALLNPRTGFRDRPGRVDADLDLIGAKPGAGREGKYQLDTERAVRLRDAGGILPSIRQTMGTWAAALNGPDPKLAKHYRENLEKIAEESESKETAAYARQLLDRAQEQQAEAIPGAANAPEPIRGASGAPR
jgi:hypothetical protein